MGVMNKTHRSSQWRTIVEEQQASGLGVAAFCRRVGVAESSFYRWCQKLRDEQQFAEVRVAPEASEHAAPERVAADDPVLELWLPHERCLLVRPGFDRQTLADLLAVLESGA
jgi:transposase-like protein